MTRGTTPPCLPSVPLPPSISPHSPTSFTFNQLLAAPRRQTFTQAAWCLGTSCVSTEQHLQLHGVNYNRRSASGGGPTRGSQRHWRLKRKRQRQKRAHHRQQFARAKFQDACKVCFPAKFSCQPIKLELYPPCTRIPRITCACTSGISGVYKESRVAYQVIRVRVS